MEEVKAVKNSGVKPVNTFKPCNTQPLPILDGSMIPIVNVAAAQLFQLSAINISWKFPSLPLGVYPCALHGRPFVDIFGHILLRDDLGNEFSLFNRDRDNPQRAFAEIEGRCCTATLQIFQFESPRCLPNTFCLVFYLKERSSDTVIMDKVEFMDCSTTDVAYDKICCFEFVPYPSSLDPHVTVEYIIFQCANLASVGLVVERILEDGTNGDSCDNVYAEITGTISATYVTRDKSYVKHVLYDSLSRSRFGDLIELSTFGVPAYTLLDIKISITVNGEDFVTRENLIFPHGLNEILIEKENYCLRILITWKHATWYLPESIIYEWCDRDPENWDILVELNREEEKETLSKKCECLLRCMIKNKFRPNGIPPSLQALNNREWIVSSCPYPLVEVFSIAVYLFGLNDSTKLGLSGTILCYDAMEEFFTFNESKRKPHIMCCSGRVPLKSVGRCYDGRNFGIRLDLKDRQGHQISKGCVVYDLDTDKKWQNRRLCSIVRGRDGFAAVHYCIFVDAVQAKVCLTVELSKFERPLGKGCQVHGRISARYGNFRYSTPYEKEFCQSMLFEKDEDEAVEILHGNIPLSKSVVAVPLNGSLIVKAHISISMNGECETLEYTFVATVDPENYGKSEILTNRIQGEKFGLSMHVVWVEAGNKANDKRSPRGG